MNEDKHRHTVWLTDEAWAKVQDHYKEDNCTKQNEYIEKAIRFYSGCLDTEGADDYLPRILAGVLDGKLSVLGDRVGRRYGAGSGSKTSGVVAGQGSHSGP